MPSRSLPPRPSLAQETARRVAALRPHARFDEALRALDRGDVEALRGLVASSPELVHARTHLEPPYGYFTAATLLHHVAYNPGRVRPDGAGSPSALVDAARLLLDAGADVDARTLGPNGWTTMGLVVTSKQASDLGLSGPLIDLLLAYGASLDLEAPDALDLPLANHARGAAERMIELGAKPDLLAAAALGRMDLLREAFDEAGRLRSRVRRRGRTMVERDAVGLTLLYAYVNRLRTHCRVDLHDAVCLDLREHVEARLREDPDSVHRRMDQWEIPWCTPLHWAAWTHIADVIGRRRHRGAAGATRRETRGGSLRRNPRGGVLPDHHIVEEPVAVLAELGRISTRFRVESVYELGRESCGVRGVRLRERPASPPYDKDYDADAGAGPAAWAERFDVSRWGVLSAFASGRRIGAAVVAWRTPELRMLAGRDDVAVLWDLRVDPEHRRAGVGSALFRRVEAWALERGCRRLEIETQNVNVPACRFYARHGCRLARVDASAYTELPHEAQLVWCKDLA